MAKVLRALVLALAAICALLCSASAWASGQVPAQPQKTYSRTLFGETYTGTIESVISITSQRYNDTNSFNTTWEGCPVRKTRSGSFSWTSEAAGSWNCSYTGTDTYVGTAPSGVCATFNLVNPANSAPQTCGSYSTVTACPSHSTPGGGSCTCDVGFSPDATGQKCDSDCVASTTNPVSSGYYDVGTEPGANPQLTACAGNCKVYFDGTSPAGSSLVGGIKHWYAKGAYYNSGGKCSAAQQAGQQVGPSSANKPPDGCAPGQGSATMNGKTVCVDQTGDGKTTTPESTDTAKTSTEKTTATNPDGSTTTTETTTKTDANGNKEVTVTKTTTGTDGKVTTTTDKTGSVPSSGTGDDSTKSECEKNPSGQGCGGPASAIDQLYTPKDKTMSGVLGAAKDAFMASPVGTAVGGFFVVSGSAACPTWHSVIPWINADVTIDQFCSSFATAALGLLKAVLLVAASFFAFRVAVE